MRLASGGLVLTLHRLHYHSTLLTVQEVAQLVIRTVEATVLFIAGSEPASALCGVFSLSSALSALQRNEVSGGIPLAVYREAAVMVKPLNNADAGL